MVASGFTGYKKENIYKLYGEEIRFSSKIFLAG